MNFSAELYIDVEKPKYSQNEKIAYLCTGIALLILIGLIYEIIPENGFIILILVACAIIPSIIDLGGFFKEEEISKKHIGMVDFALDKITWKKEKIIWSDIKDIAITFFDYKGKLLYDDSYNNSRSAGLSNKIFILTKEGKEYSANVLLQSEMESEFFANVLMEIIKVNTISYKNAKQIINPGTYAEHQELKKHSN